MTTATSDIKALESRHVLQTYKRLPVVFERGSGTRLFDEHGRSYLDFVSGIGVASLGHGHQALARALGEQAAVLAHTSNLYFHPLQGELAARLSALTGLDRAFFCNSGTEAVEACLKFARRYWYTRGDTSRTKYVAFTHSFHGRTMGSLSVTWDEHYRTPFQPLVPGVTFATASDPAELDEPPHRSGRPAEQLGGAGPGGRHQLDPDRRVHDSERADREPLGGRDFADERVSRDREQRDSSQRGEERRRHLRPDARSHAE